MELIGRPTINPVMFYTGKVWGYFTWIILIIILAGADVIRCQTFFYNQTIAKLLLIPGVILVVLSLVNLGSSVRLGLPSHNTILKTKGLYSLSRNPMYTGFNLFTISAMLYTLNMAIILPGIYSIVVYHLIIIGEENFMLQKFGAEYAAYLKKVRRYF